MDNNLILGTIPKQIGKLKSLKVVDLSKNQLVGPIPLEIGGLTSITKMYKGDCFYVLASIIRLWMILFYVYFCGFVSSEILGLMG